jgi:uncharacterized protein YceK
MKSFIIILLAVVMLSGCALTKKTAKEMDNTLAEIVKNEAQLSGDCMAGLLTGLTIASDKSAKLTLAIVALDGVADKASKDYKDCYIKGVKAATISILVNDKVEDVISKVTTLGLLK